MSGWVSHSGYLPLSPLFWAPTVERPLSPISPTDSGMRLCKRESNAVGTGYYLTRCLWDMLVVSARRPWWHGQCGDARVHLRGDSTPAALWASSYIYSTLKSQQSEILCSPRHCQLPAHIFQKAHPDTESLYSACFYSILSLKTPITKKKCCPQPSNCVLASLTGIWGTWQVSERIRMNGDRLNANFPCWIKVFWNSASQVWERMPWWPYTTSWTGWQVQATATGSVKSADEAPCSVSSHAMYNHRRVLA